MEDKLYTIPEVAKMLKIKESTVATWLRSKKLEGHKVGKAWRVSKDSLIKAYPQEEFFFKGKLDKLSSEISNIINNKELFESLYPDVYNDSGLHFVDIWEDYMRQCQTDLDRRFPYLDVDTADNPSIRRNFYLSKHNEETAKLNRLMDSLKAKNGINDEDIAEIKRTYENLQLLKIGQLMWIDTIIEALES